MPEQPIVILDEERDFLWDIRTGYVSLDKEAGHFDDHFYGEGHPKWFRILRAKRNEVPAQYEYAQVVDPDTGRGEVHKRRIRKLDIAHFEANAVPANRVKGTLLSNVYKFQARFVAGSDDDFIASVKLYDTGENAVFTVGTLFTFATITAALVPANSGDIIDVHETAGNSYAESPNTAGLTGIQIVSQVGNQAIEITAAGGFIVQLTDGCLLENFEVDGQGILAGSQAVRALGNGVEVTRVIAHAVDFGFVISGRSLTTNCLAYDCPNSGFFANLGTELWFHNTSVDNGIGFQGGAVNRWFGSANLASDNTTDYNNAFAASCAWNVSSDLTAPGVGTRTGFLRANFVNAAADDFRLATAGENGANIDGFPMVDVDFQLNTREKDTLIFFAGFHDPFVPAVGTVSTAGIIDAVPAAQGSIWVRWFEACFTGSLVPYRYDFHVKRFDGGILTAAEINAGTFFARAVFADELFGGCGGISGGSGAAPGILQALLAFESPGDITLSVVPNDENLHLFTNRQYWIAVRAVGIDPATNVIVEDNNTAVFLSFSSGHQGELFTQILDWPCLELCPGNPVQNVSAAITQMPVLNVGTMPKLEMEVTDWPAVKMPPLDIFPRGGDYPAGGEPLEAEGA